MNARGSQIAALRWGLIGASTIADEQIIPAIREAAGEVAAVYSGSDRRATELAVRHDIDRPVMSSTQCSATRTSTPCL